MPFQYDVASRNAALDAIETTVGQSPVLEIRTGAPPADCAAADTGTLLASMTLPADWAAAAANGAKALAGAWQDLSADNAGTAGHFRLKSSGGACRIQGTVTATGGGGDMTLSAAALAVGQQVTISAFTLTAGGN